MKREAHPRASGATLPVWRVTFHISPNYKQRLAKLHRLPVLAMAATALLNIRYAHVSQRRNGLVCPDIRLHNLSNHEQRLAKLHRLPVFHKNSLDDPSLIRVDFVEQLHRLNNAQSIAAIHGLANVDKCLGTR